MALLQTPICDFGWSAPDFTLPDPAGKIHSLQNYLGERGLLIAFLCNHCPYVQAIGDRLREDTNALLADGINVLGIMSNDYRAVPADAPDQMMRFAAKHGWRFPYLVDHDQTVGHAYNAVCTPDFFGFNRRGELQYRGRLDNVAMGRDASDRVPELLNAMREVAEAGKGPQDQTASIGCSIKWR